MKDMKMRPVETIAEVVTAGEAKVRYILTGQPFCFSADLATITDVVAAIAADTSSPHGTPHTLLRFAGTAQGEAKSFVVVTGAGKDGDELAERVASAADAVRNRREVTVIWDGWPAATLELLRSVSDVDDLDVRIVVI